MTERTGAAGCARTVPELPPSRHDPPNLFVPVAAGWQPPDPLFQAMNADPMVYVGFET